MVAGDLIIDIEAAEKAIANVQCSQCGASYEEIGAKLAPGVIYVPPGERICKVCRDKNSKEPRLLTYLGS